MRDKMIELIRNSGCVETWNHYTDDYKEPNPIDELADYLLANGVIVPPCKVGDKLYIVTNVSQEIVESVVIGLWMADGNFSLLTIHGVIINESIGKAAFFTKEEAEQALKEREQNER